EDPDELDWPRPFPTSREYTVRAFRPEDRELDIDFVVHDGGLASDWVVDVQPGDTAHVAGPPGGYQVPWDYSHYLLAGDETALPAIARWLETAPVDTRGWVYVDVPDQGAKQPVSPPPGVEVNWLTTGHGPSNDLDKVVR